MYELLAEEVPMNIHLLWNSNNRLLELFHQNIVAIEIVQNSYSIFCQEQFRQYPLNS
jgi:phage anti-repressor protein